MSASSLSKLKCKIVYVPAAELHVIEGNHRIVAMQILFDAKNSQKKTKNGYANPCIPESEIRAFRNQRWRGPRKAQQVKR